MSSVFSVRRPCSDFTDMLWCLTNCRIIIIIIINRVAGGQRPPSCKLWHLSLAVSGGVDCGRRQWNVYDKKPQRYAKDNRTAHLTARSDKSAAYVTNNKRLLDVLYCWSQLLTDTKHHTASLRQQSFLLLYR